MQCTQFHMEVLKRLHSMKCDLKLKESQSEAMESRADFTKISHENSDLSIGSGFESDETMFESETDRNETAPPTVQENISKILARNHDLEGVLKIKDAAIKRLTARILELENELKRKETIRLSQLELLALRNIELEKELVKNMQKSST